jgi:hypothetical protein
LCHLEDQTQPNNSDFDLTSASPGAAPSSSLASMIDTSRASGFYDVFYISPDSHVHLLSIQKGAAPSSASVSNRDLTPNGPIAIP